MTPRRTSLVLAAVLVAVAAPVVRAGAPATPALAVQTPPAPAERPVLTSNHWRAVLNFYRQTAGLVQLGENTSWSAGAVAHSRYMAANGLIAHSEVAGKPYFSAAGDTAARNGNVALSYGGTHSDRHYIEGWMAGPFHAAGMLDPRLTATGYGQAKVGERTGATLDVLRGLRREPIRAAVVWPGPGAQVPIGVYSGNEFPDPVVGCGYPPQVGLPVVVLLPDGVRVTSHALSAGGSALQHCVFDQHSYQHPDASTRSYGRDVLSGRNTVVLVPRAPLAELRPYTVTLGTSAGTLSWSFTVGEVEPPTAVTLTGPTLARPYQSATALDLSWSARDNTGIASYDVTSRRAPLSTGVMEPQVLWQNATTTTAATFTAEPGYRYCFAVRARDVAGNRTPWTAEKCTVFPWSATQLTASALLWLPQAGSYYAGVAQMSPLAGSTLTMPVNGVRRIAVLVTKCAGCGSLDVEFRGQKLATVSLSSPTTQNGVAIEVARLANRYSGDVVLRVVGALQQVTVEGLAVSQS